MANKSNESAVVFITAGNQVEIVRASAVRRLISTTKQNQLIVLDDHGQPVTYTLDAQHFIDDMVDQYGKSDDEAVHQVSVAEGLFRLVLEGKPIKVTGKVTAAAALTE